MVVRIGVVLVLLVVAGCGGDGQPATAARTAATGDAAPGFDGDEHHGLAVHRITMDDPQTGEVAYDELDDVDGWLGSYNFSGSETTLTFSPYPDQIDAAIANQERIVGGLARYGSVASDLYVVVIAEFTAAEGSPLDVDPHGGSDRFDDIAGCDWDGSALFLEHRWYCERSLDPSLAGTIRAGFAERAGIAPADVTVVRYR